jgi:four helix bundle protein
MTASVTRSEQRYDLEERTAKFGESVIALAKTIPVNLVTTSLIPQLVRAATAVGANFCEADDAGSKKEFMYRVSLCKRESRETKHWLRMIVKAEPALRETAVPLWQEAKELNLIFSAIHRRKRIRE